LGKFEIKTVEFRYSIFDTTGESAVLVLIVAVTGDPLKIFGDEKSCCYCSERGDKIILIKIGRNVDFGLLLGRFLTFSILI